MRVLITGSRAPVAIVLARALVAAGATVYTADSLRPNFGRVSRAATEDFLLPSPRFAPEACLDALARLVLRHRIDAVLPTCEETFALSEGRARLPESVRLLCPPIDVLDALHHKGRGVALAARLGIATPRVCAAPDFDRDGILKRVYSRFSCQVIPLRGSEADRRRAARARPDDGADWVWQEWIRGRELSAYSFCSAGKVLAHAAYRTPYTLGAGVFYESVDGAPFAATLAAARSLAAATGYTGSLACDAIEETNGGRVVLIEINPRATMGAALLADRPGFGKLLAGECAPGELVAGRGRRQLRAAMPLARPRFTLRWWRDFLSAPDVLADSADPGPARAAPGIYLRYAREARRLGMTPAAFATHDIEWNGPARAEGSGA